MLSEIVARRVALVISPETPALSDEDRLMVFPLWSALTVASDARGAGLSGP
jgi:hypothetical protein